MKKKRKKRCGLKERWSKKDLIFALNAVQKPNSQMDLVVMRKYCENYFILFYTTRVVYFMLHILWKVTLIIHIHNNTKCSEFSTTKPLVFHTNTFVVALCSFVCEYHTRFIVRSSICLCYFILYKRIYLKLPWRQQRSFLNPLRTKPYAHATDCHSIGDFTSLDSIFPRSGWKFGIRSHTEKIHLLVPCNCKSQLCQRTATASQWSHCGVAVLPLLLHLADF